MFHVPSHREDYLYHLYASGSLCVSATECHRGVLPAVHQGGMQETLTSHHFAKKPRQFAIFLADDLGRHSEAKQNEQAV